jgi:hypothetical protein
MELAQINVQRILYVDWLWFVEDVAISTFAGVDRIFGGSGFGVVWLVCPVGLQRCEGR